MSQNGSTQKINKMNKMTLDNRGTSVYFDVVVIAVRTVGDPLSAFLLVDGRARRGQSPATNLTLSLKPG